MFVNVERFAAGVTLVAMFATPVTADCLNPGQSTGPFGESEAGGIVCVPLVFVPGCVPGETAPGYDYPGPDYDFWMGKYEITNAQFAAFLNDAQLDGGATGRGSNMTFNDLTGAVSITSGPNGKMAVTQNVDPGSRLVYCAEAQAGQRYGVQPGFEAHPVVKLSWIGAVKFCNWLTLDSGLSEEERAYTEGPYIPDWHPVTISTNDWTYRDLFDDERQALIDGPRGYRLPMDDVGFDIFWLSEQESAFNEWYKAAAYDPAAPNGSRVGGQGELISPDHRFYGFGRDELGIEDAKYVEGGGPYAGSTAPVGYYNGGDHEGVFHTHDTANIFGLYDLSGNVFEWGQDTATVGLAPSIRGGAWNDDPDHMAVSLRGQWGRMNTEDWIGFRVVRAAHSCEGDANGDGIVDPLDAGYVLSRFDCPVGAGDCDCDRADQNDDGIVDPLDVGFALSRFGACP